MDCVCEKEKSVFRCVEEKVPSTQEGRLFVVCERKIINLLCVKKEKLSECTTTKSGEITYY